MRIMGNEVTLPDSPQAKFWAWVIGIVIASIGGWLFLETHFAARAEAVSKVEVESMIVAATSAQATAINAQTAYLIDQQTKRAIETKLFELEQIPQQQLRPQDRALYQKLVRDRAELVDLWNRRGRPLR